MTNILVLLDSRDGQVPNASLEALGAARSLAGDGQVTALFTEAISPDAAQLGAAGADQVFVAGAGAHSADGAAATGVRIAQETQSTLVFLAASARGHDLAGRLAAGLGCGLIADCVAMEQSEQGLIFTRPVYAGKAFTQVRVTTPCAVASLRANHFAPTQRDHQATILDCPPEAGKAEVTGMSGQVSGRPDVAEASKVVSGGRGLEADQWHLLEAVADALPGSALGASRAVVDAGVRPHSEQVGQTGKTVSPELYIAAGISGAIQHLAGMSSSKCIVAINKDADAPIHQHATYSIIGDVAEILPALAEELKNAQG